MERGFRNLLYFLLGFSIMIVWGLRSANAQTYSGLNHLNNIIKNTPGIATYSTTGGVNAVASGAANVATNGLTIPIPTTATARISGAGIAKLAGRALGPVGAGITAWEVYKLLKDKYTFNDQPFPNDAGIWKNGRNVTGSLTDVATDWCTYLYTVQGYTTPVNFVITANSVTFQCSKPSTGAVVPQTQGAQKISDAACPAGSTLITLLSGVKVCRSQEIPALTPEQYENKINDTATTQPDIYKDLYDALRSDQKTGVITIGDDELVPATTPVQFEMMPYIGPTTTKETTVLPDGSIQTKKEQTTITGTQTGTTVGDVKPVFQPTTTTTTTTTAPNGTTQTSTTTTVATPITQPQPKLEIPDDYNREPTQKEILDTLKNDCVKNPKKVGCAQLDDAPTAEEIPKKDEPITFSPKVFASAAGCPASISIEAGFGVSDTLSFSPICEAATTVRPIFLAIGAIAATAIFMGAITRI